MAGPAGYLSHGQENLAAHGPKQEKITQEHTHKSKYQKKNLLYIEAEALYNDRSSLLSMSR